jgi:hypothetical protein
LRGRAPDGGTARHLDLAARKVDLACCVARDQIDLMFGVVFERLEEEALGFELTLQIGLGERRALVGRRGLIPDQRDCALETSLAQGIGSLPAGLACADDGNALGRARHDLIPVSVSRAS